MPVEGNMIILNGPNQLHGAEVVALIYGQALA